jgi:hypothetical protein
VNTKDFVQSDGHPATHNRYEPAIALLEIRNTQNEYEEEEEGAEEEAR